MTFGEKLHDTLAALDKKGTAYQVTLFVRQSGKSSRLDVWDHGSGYIKAGPAHTAPVLWNTAHVINAEIHNVDAGE